MISELERILAQLRFADAVDILIVSVCVYVLLRWVQTIATRGLTIGTALLVAVYMTAVQFGLHLTMVVFEFGLAVAAVAAVVVFQHDIRRSVERVRLLSRWRGGRGLLSDASFVDGLVDTAFHLAEQRRGALIVIAGNEPLDGHVQGGTELLGRISQPLLDSLFDPHSAGHDGAVVIERGFVTRFGVHLPLSQNAEQCRGLGTRHRAGVGLSEQTDACVLIVSEERGQVSLAEAGELTCHVSREMLRELLSEQSATTPVENRRRWLSVLTSHPVARVVSLFVAMAAWTALPSEWDTVQRVFVVPVEYRNVPSDVELPADMPTEVRVTFSGTERAFQFLAPSALRVSVDLREAARGQDVFPLTESSVRRPATLKVYRIEPRTIQLRR